MWINTCIMAVVMCNRRCVCQRAGWLHLEVMEVVSP